MKLKFLPLLASTLFMLAAMCSHAQTAPVIEFNIPAGGIACGPTGSRVSCFLPVTIDGVGYTLFYEHSSQYNNGFVDIYNSDFPQATEGAGYDNYNGKFTGIATTGQTYTLEIHLLYSTYYSRGGGGRGCGGCGTKWIALPGSTISMTYVQ